MPFSLEWFYVCLSVRCLADHLQQSWKLLDYVTEPGFIYEFIFSTWCIHTSIYSIHLFTPLSMFVCRIWLTLWWTFQALFYFMLYSCVVVVPWCICVSEILTMGVSGDKIKSGFGFFDMLWWHNGIRPSSDELTKWQHLQGEFPVGRS